LLIYILSYLLIRLLRKKFYVTFKRDLRLVTDIHINELKHTFSSFKVTFWSNNNSLYIHFVPFRSFSTIFILDWKFNFVAVKSWNVLKYLFFLLHVILSIFFHYSLNTFLLENTANLTTKKYILLIKRNFPLHKNSNP
jgi:hypothetical protein